MKRPSQAILTLTLTLFLVSCGSTTQTPTNNEVLFLGDTSFGENYQKELDENILEQEGYDYTLANFKDILNDTALVVANLETTLAPEGESPYEDEKDYIHWSDAKKALKAFKEHNFSVFSLANNHSLDYGMDGLEITLDELSSAGYDSFGAGLTKEDAQEPYLFDLKGRSIAVIGAYEYSSSYDNKYDYYADETHGGVNKLNVQAISKQIEELRSADPSVYIIIFPHWGANYQDESKIQINTAHQLIDAGADMILGHGAHKLQSIEEYNGKLIVYNLGNFVFNSPGRYEENDVQPLSYIASFDPRDMVLKLYLIYTDNLQTNYQSRFANRGEFNEHSANYEYPLGHDDYGFYLYVNLEKL